MLHPTFIVDNSPDQVSYTPQQNADRTQHDPDSSGIIGAIVVVIIAALVVGSLT